MLNNRHEFKTGSIQMPAAPTGTVGCRREGARSSALARDYGGAEALHPNGEGEKRARGATIPREGAPEPAGLYPAPPCTLK